MQNFRQVPVVAHKSRLSVNKKQYKIRLGYALVGLEHYSFFNGVGFLKIFWRFFFRKHLKAVGELFNINSSGINDFECDASPIYFFHIAVARCAGNWGGYG